MKSTLPLVAILLLLMLCHSSFSQESIGKSDRITNFPARFFDKLQKRSADLEEKIIANSEKALKKLVRQEVRLKKMLARRDSLAAEQTFGNVAEKYAALQQQLQQPERSIRGDKAYLPYFDTLKTSLNFLSANSDLLSRYAGLNNKLDGALKNVTILENKLQQAETIKKYLRERRQLLKEQLSRFGLIRELKKYNKQAYYYSQQLNEYKAILEDPAKLEQKALGFIQKLPAFQDFFKKHSELASLFRLPDNYGTPQSLTGLQTRVSVQALIQERVASGGPNTQAMLQQNIQEVRNQLSQWKDKINKLGGMNSDEEMPDFKPNLQKTKSFLQRLEYGTNLQSTRSNYFFPTTTDLGLSVGYKLNDKTVIGIGASYKVGWGKDIRNISVSSQGVGFRSFADMKIKGSFYASAGFEYNYQKPFNSLQQINYLDQWQQSGLAGVSKILSLKSRLFKKTRLQLLWDFLSYRQVPETQALKFRIGYNF